MTAMLHAERVVKRYRRGTEVVLALRGATFTLEAGELVALVGPSGSGKTTLLNVLAGWEQPDDGTVTWDGRAVDAAALGWECLAVVPQRLGLLDALTIRENVTLPSRLATAPASDCRDDPRLTALGLDELADRLPAEVSLGEQQRAALARALARSPRLLLADEPTGHQDEQWARGVFAVLRDAARSGTACLVATHDGRVVAHVDRVLEIRDGHVRDAR
jgi:putative ABC transport system ATP-binding protein